MVAFVFAVVTLALVIVVLSLSLRRAWIEIFDPVDAGLLSDVALLTESVD